MRNAILLPNGLVLTTDNSAAIGEKEKDVVSISDEIVAYFAARVSILEQWAARAYPQTIIVQNFSGEESWHKYTKGIKRLFDEISEECPVITGSSETNMETMQSAMAITMLGEQQLERTQEFQWYAYGKPCVGEEVMKEADKIADLKKVWEAMKSGLVHAVWPVGSTGIKEECDRIGIEGFLNGWDVIKSAGPATTVLLGVNHTRQQEAKLYFGEYFQAII